MLGAHRIDGAHLLQQFRREARDAGKADFLALGQRIADAKIAMVGNADDVARPGLLCQFPVLRQKQHRVMNIENFLAPDMFQLGATFEMTRHQPHERDTVPVFRIHIRLDFEDKSADLAFKRRDLPPPCRGRARAWRRIGQTVQQRFHSEVIDGTAEIDGRLRPVKKRLHIELRAEAAGHFHILTQLRDRLRRQQLVKLRIVKTITGHSFIRMIFLALRNQNQTVIEQIITAKKITPHADRPTRRDHVKRQSLLDIVNEIERVKRLPVELVDEGGDRHIAQAAHLKQLAGLAFNTLRAVQHHHRAVHRRQGAIGILAEVLMARRIQQVKSLAAIIEGHDGGRHGNAPLPLHLHPVGPRAPLFPTGFHRTGKLNGAAEQQQLFGQCRLARIRMGDNCKGPPVGNPFFQHRHGRS